MLKFTVMELQNFIFSLEIFKNCSTEVIDYITSSAKIVEYQPGEVVFNEGDEGEFVYIIISGEVEIIKNYKKENQKLLSVLVEKEIFGEVSLFSLVKRTATAVAKTQTKIVKLHFQCFKDIIEKYPEDGIKIVQHMLSYIGLRLERTSKELSTIYSISKLIIEVVKGLGLKNFLSLVGNEIVSAIGSDYLVGIYIYNVFNDEFELMNIPEKIHELLPTVYLKSDSRIKTLLGAKYTETTDGKNYVFLNPMWYLKKLSGLC